MSRGRGTRTGSSRSCLCVCACLILFFTWFVLYFGFFPFVASAFFCVFEINETLIWNYMKNKRTNKEWRIRVLYFIFFLFRLVFTCDGLPSSFGWCCLFLWSVFVWDLYLFFFFFVSNLKFYAPQFYTSWTIFLFASGSLCNRSTKIFAIFLSSFLKSGQNSRINFVNTQSIDLFLLIEIFFSNIIIIITRSWF